MIRTDPSSKLLLVADQRTGVPVGASGVRRFRLARLPLAGRAAAAATPPRIAARR